MEIEARYKEDEYTKKYYSEVYHGSNKKISKETRKKFERDFKREFSANYYTACYCTACLIYYF
jgi:hypothetical protein